MRCCYSKAEDNITYSLTLKIQDLERDYRIINKWNLKKDKVSLEYIYFAELEES